MVGDWSVGMLRREIARIQKKPDVSLYVHVTVQPRTCSQNDKKTPSKTRRHNLPVQAFQSESKKSLRNLAGFHVLLLKYG